MPVVASGRLGWRSIERLRGDRMTLEDLARKARIVEAAWCAAWASLGALSAIPRTFADDTPDFLRVYTPTQQEMLLNIVLRYRNAEPVTAESIERVIAPYRKHRLPFQWWLTLGSDPQGLREQLHTLGMRSWGGATAMTLDFAGWEPRYHAPAPDVTLTQAKTAQDTQAALRVICDVFYVPERPMARWTTENPAFQVYLARLAGRPVSALATMWHEGVVGVYHVATLPMARRRGISGNLLLLALREARDAGCALASLTATAEARHLYEEIGFESCGMMEQWSPGYDLNTMLTSGSRQRPFYNSPA